MKLTGAPLGKALLCGLTAALIATPTFAADKLLIGSTSGSSSHYGYFVAVGKLINDSVKDVEASVVETGATLDNLRRLERDQVDLGLVTTNVAQHAVSGSGEFEGHPIDLRLLWVYTGAPQNVVARADAGLSSLADLTGKRFNPGIRGSATESTTEAVLAKLDIAPDYVRGSTIDIATFTDINILSLTPDQAATLKTEMPDISVVDIPAGAGEGIPAYTTWSFGVGAATTPEMDEETAYQIVKAVMEDKSAQAAAMASLKGADLAKLTLTYGTIPLHPGAVRYFKEQGLDIPDRLLPPAQ
jgi:TRAP-type uncharacterized transport system substrate-binding protein